MIVVDTDVIAAFWIRGPRTPAALGARRRDPDWAAPVLWRSEFRSVLRQYMLAGHIGYSDAVWIADKAEASMRGKEYTVATASVLKLVERTGHSSYDCEFVALADAMGLHLVTGDGKIARVFPDVAVSLEEFATIEK
ncbi:MAG TPA: type II toxin-antitoxin system VapC family toxin [Rhodothermales bacterium]|nr:type II toxin-antitoxin system VapC family toxin [Rhodothermales bacterium]